MNVHVQNFIELNIAIESKPSNCLGCIRLQVTKGGARMDVVNKSLRSHISVTACFCLAVRRVTYGPCRPR